MKEQTIVLTWPDHAQLTALVEAQQFRKNGYDAAAFQRLAGELARAQLVASQDIPSDVVTMESHLRVHDLDTNESFDFTLSWPDKSDPANGRINVLAPLGMALLGCRVSQEVEWPVPNGMRRLRVDEVISQPENRTAPEAH